MRSAFMQRYWTVKKNETREFYGQEWCTDLMSGLTCEWTSYIWSNEFLSKQPILTIKVGNDLAVTNIKL